MGFVANVLDRGQAIELSIPPEQRVFVLHVRIELAMANRMDPTGVPVAALIIRLSSPHTW
jgi:hypothetical protein